ncbi:hypothetical protein [Nitrosopumilus sp.]|uniref:hypothetical protein n=1 Tax=Nitrosopumilus sp. TaxID=2024843 RepID=UPI00260F4EDD|nr:hypothetical protein [Nitrosopumilus sp.]
MKFFTLFGMLTFLSFSIFGNYLAEAQVDPLSNIVFLQTGQINTDENQFQISNDVTVREFFGGKIIRISGQTIEGFPYITYSKVSEEKTDSRGIIFINGQFANLSFLEKTTDDKTITEKNDELAIVVQYTQRVYSEKYVKIDVKIFEKSQNKLNDFYQNYGYKQNTNISVSIINEDDQKVFSSNGITDKNGLYQTEFFIPENFKRQTLIVTITAENNDSKSSRVLQIFSLGQQSDDGKSSIP